MAGLNLVSEPQLVLMATSLFMAVVIGSGLHPALSLQGVPFSVPGLSDPELPGTGLAFTLNDIFLVVFFLGLTGFSKQYSVSLKTHGGTWLTDGWFNVGVQGVPWGYIQGH